jgi:hypothetical protein
MLIEIYVVFVIIAFVFFLLSMYLNEGFLTIFTWPITAVLFTALFFASYNIQKVTYTGEVVSFIEQGFSYIFLGMAALSGIFLILDFWDKFRG